MEKGESKLLNNLINENDIFNKLKELQKLIKKESAIKELFIKTKNETKKCIEQQCIDIYQKKMEVLNILQKIKNAKENNAPNLLKEHIFVENNYEYLLGLTTYITIILSNLWEEPKLIANLLINANKNDVKDYLAPLICNNFYENILSPNYIEDPLIYIIYIMLNNEIDNMKDINQGINDFLNDTSCSYLLKQLIEKNDIKEFFKIILQDALEDIGTNKFMFNIKEIYNWSKEEGKSFNKSVFEKNYLSSKNLDNKGKKLSGDKNDTEVKDIRKIKTISKVDIQGIEENDKENIKNNINYQVFTAVYLTSIPISEIKKNIDKYKDDIYLKNYYEYLLLNAKGDYSQNTFVGNLYEYTDSESIIVFYQESFLKVKDFINKFLVTFISNFRIIPYTIKYVSKIILQLINNKFPEANEIQKNLFISKFLYKILIFPIFEKPDINALINDYIISNNTLYNMKFISDIMWTLASFKLYRDDDPLKGEFTPFNRFFLEIIPKIFGINKLVTDINLPKFIEGLINKTINEDEYYFDLFNENHNQIFFYKSILLNIKEFYSLFSTLLKFKDILLKQKEEKNNKVQNNINSKYIEFKNKSEKNVKLILSAVEKLNSKNNLKMLTDLINKKEYSIISEKIKGSKVFKKSKIIEEKREKIKYFHVSELLFNKKSKELFSLEQKYFYYHIKELKEKDSQNKNPKELQTKNNIIKCKNFISSILYNYRNLEKNDFNKNTINNFMDILKELTHFMKSSNYLIDGTIPSEWYLISMRECLKKLPDEYKNNEYEKLFEELTSELNESINKCNAEYLSMLIDGMKLGDKNKNYYDTIKEIYLDIELNNKANNIIENDNISFNFKIIEKKRESIKSKKLIKSKTFNFDNNIFIAENLFKDKFTKTIENFIKDFPNLNQYKLNKYNSKEKINIFEFQEEINLPNKIISYFTIIYQYLKNKVKNENELDLINDKIYDYFMSRIYDKIYPKVKHKSDEEIFLNTCKLSWVEPENIINEEVNYDFDLVLPDINKYFNLIRNEKSPRKKLNNLNNIFISIKKLIQFTKGDSFEGVDDQFPLLTYCFIKSRPWGIYTDCNFMQLYIGNKKDEIENSELAQLLSICNFIKEVKYNSLYNINENEFNEKNELSLKELKEYIEQFNIKDIF